MAGRGFRRGAETLNRVHVPPPRAHARDWAPTAIREILHRELYRGVVVWNRIRKAYRGGAKRQILRPEAEWWPFRSAREPARSTTLAIISREIGFTK